MSNYTKATNFATKDALPTGNALKIVSGTEIDTEFSNIETAVNTKANIASPTFTGVPAAPTATAGTNTTQVATTEFVKAAADTKLPLAGGTMTGVIAGFESTGIDDNATSTAVTIDSSGNVGIGTSSPVGKLSISGGTATNEASHVTFQNTSGAKVFAVGGGKSGVSNNGFSIVNVTDNTAPLTISDSGNVGIGTSSPARGLHLNYSNDAASIRLQNTANAKVWDLSPSIPNVANSGFSLHNVTDNTVPLHIDNSGNVGIGRISAGITLDVLGTTSHPCRVQSPLSTVGLLLDNTSASGTIYFTHFRVNNVQKGQITSDRNSITYGSNSDYRLKENVVPMTGATEAVKLLKPVNFDWIETGDNVNGFLAHELAEVVPEAATGTKDAMRDEEYEVTPATGDVFTAGSEAGFTEVSPAIAASPAYYDVDGNVIKAEVIAQAAVHEVYDAVAEVIHSADATNPETLEEGQQWRETTAQVMATRSVPDMQGIDQAKIVPLLTATIQELIARIETLEQGE